MATSMADEQIQSTEQSTRPAQGDISTGPDAGLASRWHSFEERFETNLYGGAEAPCTVISVSPTSFPQLVLTAVHGVNHTRGGAPKLADRGTGGLVLLLAELLGCAAIVVAGTDSGDGNYDAEHPAKVAVTRLLTPPQFLVDIHGMQDRGIDLELGTGLSDYVPETILNAFNTGIHSLIVAVDVNFNAGGTGTMTRWAQEGGIRACQIEVSARMRPPTATPVNMENLLDALTHLLLRLKQGPPT